MRLLILRQTSISGQPARVGDVVNVSDRDARLLINSAKAELAPMAPEDVELTQDQETIQRKPRKRRLKSNGTA
jgi:hypothetical protein